MVTRDAKMLALGVVLAILATPAVLGHWQLLLAFPALVALMLFRNPVFRLHVFVWGAFLVFQSGDGLSAQKLAYLVAVIGAASISTLRVTRGVTAWQMSMRPALHGALLLTASIALVAAPYSMIVQHVDPVMFARDGLTYLLIAAAVPIAVDAAGSMTLAQARVVTYVVGAVSAVGFAYNWIQIRGYGQATDVTTPTSSGGILLSSLVALTVPIALLIAFGLAGKRVRPVAILAAGILVVAVLITGTRTGLLLFLVVLGMAGTKRAYRVGILRIVGGLGISAVTAIVLIPLAATRFSSRDSVLSRLGSVRDMMTGGGLGGDRSGLIRLRATEYANSIFEAHPLLGQGLGFYFPNPNPGGVATNFSLDTPSMYLAKFGLFGCTVLLASLVLIIGACVRSSARFGGSIESTAVSGAALVWVCLLPLAATTEDKGFALSICLSVLLVSVSRREAANVPTLSLQGHIRELAS